MLRSSLRAVRQAIGEGKPFLGICLGMQLLFSESEEMGRHGGLGVIPGRVLRFDWDSAPAAGALKVPHMGWNTLTLERAIPLLEGVPTGAMVYFVHSFTAVPAREEHRLADAEYGGERISAAVHRDNVWGCQFHPEKSGETGLAILREFLAA